MYRHVPDVDAVVGIAASGALDEFTLLSSVPMDTLVEHYVDCIEGDATGQIIRA